MRVCVCVRASVCVRVLACVFVWAVWATSMGVRGASEKQGYNSLSLIVFRSPSLHSFRDALIMQNSTSASSLWHIKEEHACTR